MRIRQSTMVFSLGQMLTLSLCLGACLTAAVPAVAAPAKAKDAKAKTAVDDDELDFPPLADEVVVRKHYSTAEVQRMCARYEGHLIAFYDDIYKVEHCVRRPILDNKTVYNLQRDGQKVQDVTSNVIAALPAGEALDEATTAKYARSCAQLEGHYVTYSNVDVYFIEHCKKRIFPDWTTYIKHRERRRDKTGEIYSLSWLEFSRLPMGEQVPSIVDDLFARLLTGAAQVEVIPINEACEGLEGRIAAYYSHVYRVEHCRKRDIAEPDRYLKKLGIDKVKVAEMSSEQWLSLPSGPPLKEGGMQEGKTPSELHPPLSR